VNVPANVGRAVWEAIMAAGAEFDITPYGTETMHVLRAEKGYIIVGQDTDGSMTPFDVGMGGLVAKSKDFLGKRSLTRSDTSKAGRKQLVGLLAEDASFVIPEGSQIVAGPFSGATAPMLGHVTSSYFSPVLKRSIALAVIKGGLDKVGESVTIPLAGGRQMAAKITSSVFYDSEGARQHVE
jgi:sarcosine oxidase subunit alpha